MYTSSLSLGILGKTAIAIRKETQVPSLNSLELEQEVGKIARAMMTRNSQIGEDIIAHLRTQLTLQEVAGVMIVSIERLIWFDIDSVFWSIENIIPADIMQEIQKITSVAIYKQLIGKGFMPGKDFSVDAFGKLLMNELAKKSIFPRLGSTPVQ